jgi:DNA invertase Pin-like site-specific DNA recombinase
MNDKIKPQHLARKAVVYVRQSSAHQVSHNLESQRLQYAMQQRLQQLGWHEIEVVDEDLGRSAAGMVNRRGFERMVADVCLGKVGAVTALEVSRFARNSREWQQLVEVCRVVDTVLIDQDTVYAPRQSNDRLLLGLKGSLNEYELDLLRQRSVEARLQKARRGELLILSPVGYRKGEGRLEKDPDLRVQEAVMLVFRKLLELGSVRQTLLWFHEQGLELPAINAREQVRWKRPTYGMVYAMLTNPVYAGTYTYGKTERRTCYDGSVARQSVHRKPREQWLSFIPDTHEAYISSEQFERVQATTPPNLWRHLLVYMILTQIVAPHLGLGHAEVALVAAGFGLAVRATRASVVVIAAPTLGVDITLALLQALTGLGDGLQARFAPLDLSRNVELGLVGLGLIGVLDALQQRINLGLEFSFGQSHAFIAHGLVTAGVGLDLGAVDGHRAELDHLHKQFAELLEVQRPEVADRAVVRKVARGQEPKRQILVEPALDLA